VPAPRRAGFALLGSLAVLLLLAVLTARGRSAVPKGQGLLINGGLVTPTNHDPPLIKPPSSPRINPVLGIGLSTIIAVALVAFLFSMVSVLLMIRLNRGRRRRRQSRPAVPAHEPVGAGEPELAMVLLRGTRSALELLRGRSGGPPSDAVQAAWLALEEAAAESGTTRHPHQTPTEFTGAVLAAHAVDRAALAALRGLYQRARFGRSESVTEADADTAVSALERIAHDLAAGREAVGRT
jgi:hypothetical protein